MDQTSLLADFTRRLARTAPESPLSLRLCHAFTDTIGADGGAITMGCAPAERITLCATDEPAAQVEDAQEILREGPSLDAFSTGTAVSGVPDVEAFVRWPMLYEMLSARGATMNLHAFPVRPDGAVLGVVSAYQTDDRGIAVDDADAQFLANALGVVLLGDLGTHSVTSDSWADRDRVDQATGMVVAQLRVPPADALAVLRAHAFAHATTLPEVSSLVLMRRLTFSDTDASDGNQ